MINLAFLNKAIRRPQILQQQKHLEPFMHRRGRSRTMTIRPHGVCARPKSLLYFLDILIKKFPARKTPSHKWSIKISWIEYKFNSINNTIFCLPAAVQHTAAVKQRLQILCSGRNLRPVARPGRFRVDVNQLWLNAAINRGYFISHFSYNYHALRLTYYPSPYK